MLFLVVNENKALGSKKIEMECPHCGENKAVFICVYFTYSHILFIPVIGIKKRMIWCASCKNKIKKAYLPDHLKQTYRQTYKQYRVPIWAYSFLMILGFFLVTGTFFVSSSMQREGEDTKENMRKSVIHCLNDPQVGDIYNVKMTDGGEAVYRLRAFTKDSSFFNILQIKRKGSPKLRDNMQFEDSINLVKKPCAFSRKQLEQMANNFSLDDIMQSGGALSQQELDNLPQNAS